MLSYEENKNEIEKVYIFSVPTNKTMLCCQDESVLRTDSMSRLIVMFFWFPIFVSFLFSLFSIIVYIESRVLNKLP